MKSESIDRVSDCDLKSASIWLARNVSRSARTSDAVWVESNAFLQLVEKFGKLLG